MFLDLLAKSIKAFLRVPSRCENENCLSNELKACTVGVYLTIQMNTSTSDPFYRF